jgi:hypothetical protein
VTQIGVGFKVLEHEGAVLIGITDGQGKDIMLSLYDEDLEDFDKLYQESVRAARIHQAPEKTYTPDDYDEEAPPMLVAAIVSGCEFCDDFCCEDRQYPDLQATDGEDDNPLGDLLDLLRRMAGDEDEKPPKWFREMLEDDAVPEAGVFGPLHKFWFGGK